MPLQEILKFKECIIGKKLKKKIKTILKADKILGETT